MQRSEDRERSRSTSTTPHDVSLGANSCKHRDNVVDDTVAKDQGDILIINDNVTAQIADDYLKMLGDDPNDNKEHSFELHNALGSRLCHIITNGLSKATKDELWHKYPFQTNCPTTTTNYPRSHKYI